LDENPRLFFDDKPKVLHNERRNFLGTELNLSKTLQMRTCACSPSFIFGPIHPSVSAPGCHIACFSATSEESSKHGWLPLSVCESSNNTGESSNNTVSSP
jgi:hypothetical protein